MPLGARAGYSSASMTHRAVQQLLLVSLSCTLASCPSAEDVRPTPNVIVLVLDTVRPDHLSCYGYRLPTTPNLDALAATADRYTQARSTAPWTLPSHASLFTGLFPFQHHADAFLKDGRVEDARPLPAEAVTLAEVLKQEGFVTGGFAANTGYLNRASGLDQGFDEYVVGRLAAPGMSAAALAWVAKVTAPPTPPAPTTRAPFFLFVNYMDAHRTYNTAPLGEERAKQLPAPPPEGETGDTYLDALCEHVLGQETPPDPELVRKTIEAYDLALANLDAGLGELFDGLKRSGHFEDALIVICADHGEYFGEHDLAEHSKDVYEPAMRIPLIVKRPGQKEGRVIADPISIADVPKAILASFPEAIALRHAGKFPGTSGVGSMLGQIHYTRPKDLNKAWGPRFRRERDVLYEGRYKLIRSSDGRHELYDLENDRDEQRNLFDERPLEATKLMQRLELLERQVTTIRAAQEGIKRTPQEQQDLERLGYVDKSTADDSASKKPVKKH